jgi:PKD repeat protein
MLQIRSIRRLTLGALVGTALAACEGPGAVTETNQPPTASFSFLPSNPSVDEVVTFDASASSDPDGSIVEYRWDLDNDSVFDVTGTEPTTTHSFSELGNHRVTLEVVDDQDATGDMAMVLAVGGNQRPTASFTFSPDYPDAGESTSFDASESEDPDGTIVEYRWDFDSDGTVDHTSVEPTASHTFTEEGAFTVVLTVVDDEGATGQTNRTVYVGGY